MCVFTPSSPLPSQCPQLCLNYLNKMKIWSSPFLTWKCPRISQVLSWDGKSRCFQRLGRPREYVSREVWQCRKCRGHTCWKAVFTTGCHAWWRLHAPSCSVSLPALLASPLAIFHGHLGLQSWRLFTVMPKGHILSWLDASGCVILCACMSFHPHSLFPQKRPTLSIF